MRILSSVSSTGALVFLNGGDMLVNGATIGLGGGQGTTNMAIGPYALSSNSAGIVNIAIGSFALSSNTTANFNTAIGANSLRVNST